MISKKENKTKGASPWIHNDRKQKKQEFIS